MNIILLSGGSGKRLWPLSNDIRSKQFIQFFKTKKGHESMLQRVYHQIKQVDDKANIVVATSKSQLSTINNQLGMNVSVSIEPCRRDTFPAIALSVMYLHDVLQIDENEAVVVCPVDPYVENDYFETIQKLYKRALENNTANLVLMGIKPNHPSEKFGYIIPTSNEELSTVSCFKEKPNKEVASEYITQGALWNGGIFAFKLRYVMDIAHKLINFSDYYDLYNKYESAPKISFDYAVVEKEKNIEVIRFNGKWNDIGTWNALVDTIDEKVIGKGVLDDKNENVSIINELDMPILAMGLKDVIIAASPEGILVSDKEQSANIKPFVDQFNGKIMFSEKSWGSYQVINVEKESSTILVTLNPGASMNYHSHKNRNEVWVVIEGEGITTVDGFEQIVQTGDVITMKAGTRHKIKASTYLKLIEVQIGKEISVHDKIKYEDEC